MLSFLSRKKGVSKDYGSLLEAKTEPETGSTKTASLCVGFHNTLGEGKLYRYDGTTFSSSNHQKTIRKIYKPPTLSFVWSFGLDPATWEVLKNNPKKIRVATLEFVFMPLKSWGPQEYPCLRSPETEMPLLKVKQHVDRKARA